MVFLVPWKLVRVFKFLKEFISELYHPKQLLPLAEMTSRRPITDPTCCSHISLLSGYMRKCPYRNCSRGTCRHFSLAGPKREINGVVHGRKQKATKYYPLFYC